MLQEPPLRHRKCNEIQLDVSWPETRIVKESCFNAKVIPRSSVVQVKRTKLSAKKRFLADSFSRPLKSSEWIQASLKRDAV